MQEVQLAFGFRASTAGGRLSSNTAAANRRPDHPNPSRPSHGRAPC